MIRSKQRRKIEERFHELAVKEALQTITTEEHSKLERYQQLRRNGRPESPMLVRSLREIGIARKYLTYIGRKFEGLKHSPPKHL